MQNLGASNGAQSKGSSNDGASPRKTRRLSERKDPEQEFFHMLLLSHIIGHPKQNLLIEVQTEAETLYKQVKQTGQPFFQWNQWISDYIQKTLDDYKDKRNKRLEKIGKD